MAVAAAKEDFDYTIKPEAVAPTISTSEWPLLLKNYEKREFQAYELSIDNCLFFFFGSHGIVANTARPNDSPR